MKGEAVRRFYVKLCKYIRLSQQAGILHCKRPYGAGKGSFVIHKEINGPVRQEVIKRWPEFFRSFRGLQYGIVRFQRNRLQKAGICKRGMVKL